MHFFKSVTKTLFSSFYIRTFFSLTKNEKNIMSKMLANPLDKGFYDKKTQQIKNIKNIIENTSQDMSNTAFTISKMTPNELSRNIRDAIKANDKSKAEIGYQMLKYATNNSQKNSITSIDLMTMIVVHGLNLGYYVDALDTILILISKHSDKNQQIKVLSDIINNGSLEEVTIKELIEKNVKYPDLNEVLKQIKYKK
jgi:hypothetical protein